MIMDEEQLAWDLEHSPSLKLLAADLAPLIISFLHQQFKRGQRVSIPWSELIEQLEGYLAYLNERTPGRYPRSAREYLTTWADESHQFIRIIVYGSQGGDTVELTSDTERAIGWLEDMQGKAFVGTESRFFMIVQLLREIVQKSTEDPEQRLKQLEDQRAELDAQIAVIKQTGKVENRYTPTQVQERFFEASQLGRQLLRDFRLVEEKFREMARSIQQAQLQAGVRKGSLVEYVLDADAELKNSDQGRSFYTFWEFLMSPTQGDELRKLLEKMGELDDLRQVLHDDRLLSRLPGYLVNAGEKVVHSNARLAEQLRRLLDEQILVENRRVHELIQEIKQTMYLHRDILPEREAYSELEGDPEVQLVMERDLWSPAKFQAFSEQPALVDLEDLSTTDFTGLYQQFSVDEMELRRRIEHVLEYKAQISLAEVLAQYPLEKGLAEVLAYCVLAARDPRHEIDLVATEELSIGTFWAETPWERAIVVPRVVYRRSEYVQ